MRYILVIVVLFLGVCISASAENARRPEIFAHSGMLEDVPENTFAALIRAIELGIDGVEVDVRQTKDGQLILMNDETIDRTTDGTGRVVQLLYAEIKQYDCGSWKGAEFDGEPVPLLADVLRFCKSNNLKLMLDIKQPFLEEKVSELVKATGMSSQVYIWRTSANLIGNYTDSSWKELVFISPGNISKERLRRIHEEEKYSFTTVLGSDSREYIKHIMHTGVDVLVLDYPCVAMDILHTEALIITNKGRYKELLRNKVRQESNYSYDNKGYILEKINGLVETIKGADNDKARTAAMAVTVFPRDLVVPALIELLEDKNPHTRRHAVWALGFCGGRDVASYIHPLLLDKRTEVRREAVLALKRLNAIQSVQLLIKALQVEKDAWVRYDIARTLGSIGHRGAVFILIDTLLKEKNWHVKSACAEALGRIADEKAVVALADILITDAGEEAAWTRAKAAWALASIGKESVPFLIRALRDNEEATRRRAMWALVKIGLPAVSALKNSLYDVSPHARKRAAQALGWIGDEKAVQTLIWALRDETPSVVCSVIWALGRIGSKKALPALKPLVNSKVPEIRELASEAIERITIRNKEMAYHRDME